MTVLSLCFYHSFLFPLFPAVLIIYLFVSVREYLYDIFNGFKNSIRSFSLPIQNAKGTSTIAWSLQNSPGQLCTGSSIRRYMSQLLDLLLQTISYPRWWCLHMVVSVLSKFLIWQNSNVMWSVKSNIIWKHIFGKNFTLIIEILHYTYSFQFFTPQNLVFFYQIYFHHFMKSVQDSFHIFICLIFFSFVLCVLGYFPRGSEEEAACHQKTSLQVYCGCNIRGYSKEKNRETRS